MSGEPEGTMVDGAYFHEGPNKKFAVILLTDIFGLPLVNNKLLVDRFSKELQCDVWAPHYFNGASISLFITRVVALIVFKGDPIFRAEELEPLLPHKAGDKIGTLNSLRFFGTFITRIHRFWGNRSAVVDPIVDSVRASNLVSF